MERLWIEEEHVGLPEIFNPIRTDTSELEKADELVELSRRNRPVLDAVIDRMPPHLRMFANSNEKSHATILGKAARPSIREGKSWFRVEHLRDALRFRTIFSEVDDIIILRDLFLDSCFSFVKVDLDKFLKPKLSGWRFVAFDMRIGAGAQIVEFYATLQEVLANDSHDFHEKWRNLSKEERVRRHAEYQKEWEDVTARSREVWQEALARLSLSEDELKKVWADLRERMFELSKAPQDMPTE